MCMMDQLKDRRNAIYALAAKNKISRVAVFGSCARYEDTSDSDVDFLVDFMEGATLFDHANMMNDLEDLLKRKVDVVSRRGLHPYIREHVLQEAVDL